MADTNIVTNADGVEYDPEDTIFGVVTDCENLRIRSEAQEGDNVISAITKGTVVEVDYSKSTGDFYHVITESGLSGFCMKKFITIK